MARKSYTTEQIIGLLRQAGLGLENGGVAGVYNPSSGPGADSPSDCAQGLILEPAQKKTGARPLPSLGLRGAALQAAALSLSSSCTSSAACAFGCKLFR